MAEDKFVADFEFCHEILGRIEDLEEKRESDTQAVVQALKLINNNLESINRLERSSDMLWTFIALHALMLAFITVGGVYWLSSLPL